MPQLFSPCVLRGAFLFFRERVSAAVVRQMEDVAATKSVNQIGIPELGKNKKGADFFSAFGRFRTPYGNRTRVLSVKGIRPNP